MKNRIQWEYCQLDSNTIFFYQTQKRTPIKNTFEERTKAVAQMGIDGWELVTVWGSIPQEHTFYFKRPLEKEDL